MHGRVLISGAGAFEEPKEQPAAPARFPRLSQAHFSTSIED